LMLAYMFSYLDRQILNLLVEPIKADLNITDFQMSLLMGIAFASVYSIMGFPISRWVDSRSRRKLIFWGITTWSLMTALCGWARNYLLLFLGRFGVGVGEAALNPSAFSMIGDSFSESRRPLAIAIFHLGNPVGQGLAMIIGGIVIDLVSGLKPEQIPSIGIAYPWQLTFFIVGIPGLMVAALVRTIREPKRQGLIAAGKSAGAAKISIPIREVLAFIWVRRLAYTALIVGIAIKVTLAYGSVSWIPTYFIRSYGWTAGEFGLVYGIWYIAVGIVSTFFAGILANRMTARGHRDANMKVILVGYVVGIPFAVIAPLMPNAGMAILMFMITFFFTNFHVLAPAALIAITPNQVRGQISAIYVFMLNIIGVGIGPSIVAASTDFLYGSELAVGKSLVLVASTLGPLGAVLFYSGMKAYRRCLEDSRQWETAESGE
ncbi:MAG: MFS transporter, partial [Acidobacteria bacterium]|nr:MFS transporter [Acidobacteriota bacterium]